jgi:hypothetical protein
MIPFIQSVSILMAAGLIVTTACRHRQHTSQGNEKSSIYLYRRDKGGNNGDWSSYDMLAITSYVNKTISVDSFVRIARNYIDTVQADTPVRMVVFMGQAPGERLPSPNPDNIDQQIAHYLLAFSFDRTIPWRKAGIYNLSVWKNGEKFPALVLDRDLGKGPALDSALHSTQPFDNGF